MIEINKLNSILSSIGDYRVFKVEMSYNSNCSILIKMCNENFVYEFLLHNVTDFRIKVDLVINQWIFSSYYCIDNDVITIDFIPHTVFELDENYTMDDFDRSILAFKLDVDNVFFKESIIN